jgi:hypothetical protein
VVPCFGAFGPGGPSAPDAYIGSKTGDSFARAPSASFLIARSGCVAGTRVSGDISINIEDCLAFSPRIMAGT